MISVLNRYIIKRVMSGTTLAFIIVTGIIMLVDFVEGSRNFGADENIGLSTLLFLTILKTPTLIEQTIPFVILFGLMGTLYNLNRRSELIVLRASGLSAWKFLSPAILTTAFFGLIWSLIFNPLASLAMDTHDNFLKRTTGTEINKTDKAIWLREGDDVSQTVIYAKEVDILNRRILDTTFYIFDYDKEGTARFNRRFDAKGAQLVTQGYWQLEEVIENAEGELTRSQSAISLPTTITMEDISSFAHNKSSVPFWGLMQEIRRTEKAGFSAVSLRMQFNKLLALPVMLIAMTIIAACVSMRFNRKGGALRLLIIGSFLGFAVYFADNVVSAFGQATILPILLAAWSVPLFVLFCGLSYLAIIEDG